MYDRKNALLAADMLNDRVIPFFDSKEIPVLCVLTDRGSEYCGNREHHEYELYLDQENIDHTKTKAKSPQTNGICERFHKIILSEFYQIAFRKKIYESIEMLQNDLDEWLREYKITSAQREILLWENADADIPGFPATCKRENVAV